MKLAETKKVKVGELKAGDQVELSSYEKGMTWIDTVVSIEDYTWSNGKDGYKIFWKRGLDGYKTRLCGVNNTFNKVVETL